MIKHRVHVIQNLNYLICIIEIQSNDKKNLILSRI